MEDTLTEMGRRIVQVSELAAAMHIEAVLQGGSPTCLRSFNDGVREIPARIDRPRRLASAGRLVRRWFR